MYFSNTKRKFLQHNSLRKRNYHIIFSAKKILRVELFETCSTDKVVEAVEPEVSKTDALEEWCEDELESRCLVVLMNIARIANAVQVTL